MIQIRTLWDCMRKFRVAALTIACFLVISDGSARAAMTFTVTNTNDSGPGSLRQAIIDANASKGKDTIAFNIGGGGFQVIKPTNVLQLTDPAVVDGTTQPGYSGIPLIQLDGGGGGGLGLLVDAGDTTIRGLDIVGFGEGIRLTGLGNDLVAGNVIGAAPNAGDVTDAMPNKIGITVPDARGSTIGGTTPADRNVISGNGIGIQLTATDDQVIAGNFIGTNRTGTAPLPNDLGIEVADASRRNVIGEPFGGPNVISGNKHDGVFLTNCPLPGSLYYPGCPSSGQGPSRTVIRSNMIGVDVTGTAALPNGDTGITVSPADRTAIGGVPFGSGNVVSGNGEHGIFVAGSDRTTIGGNVIGTNVAGTGAVPNGFDGIRILRCTRTRVGGFAADIFIFGASNLISGNAHDGVRVLDSSDTSVLSNEIGTDDSGTFALGNGGNGVEIVAQTAETHDNLVGFPDAGNLISGNGHAGIAIVSPPNPGPNDADHNEVYANLIGTNAAGNAAIPNETGVSIMFASKNQIGDIAKGADNLIAGNKKDGVLILGDANLVQGDRIGGVGALGNGRDGVRFEVGNDNRVRSNTIVGNAGVGVDVTGGIYGIAAGTAIHENSIVLNGGLGIDVWPAGVTPNDLGDASPPQNFPLLVGVTTKGNNSVVQGFLNSSPLTTFAIEVFASAFCDPSGYGEGQVYVGSTNVKTDSQGNGAFTFSFSPPLQVPVLTATASRAFGIYETSEFSPCKNAG